MGSHQRFQRFTVRRQNNHRIGGQPGHHDFPSQLPIRHATTPPIRLLFCYRKAASLRLPSYLHARRSRNFRSAVLADSDAGSGVHGRRRAARSQIHVIDSPFAGSAVLPRACGKQSRSTVADYLLAIDQGTTSTRAILFDGALIPVASAQQEFRQIYPGPGLVEHDPEEIWQTVIATARAAMAKVDARASDIAAIGIANQRETAIVWDRGSGRPIHNAIVWQDRRTADRCEALREAGHEAMIANRTGLLLDPYFSATKIGWLLDHVDGARAAAGRGALAFGTVDSYLLWRLTGGQIHATDATNASRTLLFDIESGRWDAELCDLFGVPPALLPQVNDCEADFGTSRPDLFGGAIRILGVAGDQQAAADRLLRA